MKRSRTNKLLVRLIRGKSCQSPQQMGQDFPRGVLVSGRFACQNNRIGACLTLASPFGKGKFSKLDSPPFSKGYFEH
jgi:hypothetical protein